MASTSRREERSGGEAGRGSTKPLSLQPIRKRLMIPLSLILLGLVGVFAGYTILREQKEADRSVRALMETATNDLAQLTEEQSRLLAALGEVLVDDPALRSALAERDRARLMEAAEPIFRKIRADYNVTYFYFFAPDHTCLLRVHEPERFGDRVDRFIFQEAERSGRVATGIELGPLGTFAFRSMHPVTDGTRLLGHIELSKGIESTLETIHERYGIELALAIRKDRLTRSVWEGNMKRLGSEADWERLPSAALVYSSLSPLPTEADPFFGGAADRTGEIEFGDRPWSVAVHSQKDASGAPIGTLLLLQDVSRIKEDRNRMRLLITGAVLAILAGLLGFVSGLLRRTDRAISRQQAELREQVERYDLVMEGVKDAVWDWDLAKGQVHVSPRWRELHRSASDVIGTEAAEWARWIHPEDFPGVREQVKAHLEGRTPVFSAEYRVGSGTETWTWALGRGVAQRDANGVAIRMAGSETDITERKRAEEILKESEANFRGFFQSIDDFILAATPDGRILFANRSFERKLGYGAEEWSSMRLLDIYPLETREEAKQTLEEVFRGERESCAVMVGAKNGNRIPVEARGWAGRWNGREGIFLVGKDLSAEREAQLHFEQLFRINPVLMLLSSWPDRCVTEVNDAFLRALGYARDEVIGRTEEDLRLFSNAELAALLLEQLRTRHGLHDWTCRLRRKDGGFLDVILSGEMLKGGKGEFVLISMLDITDRKRSEQEKVKLREELQQAMKMEAVGRLAGGVAHDFNNLLTGIIGNVQIMQMDLRSGDPMLADLREVQKAAESAASLTRQLLAFSRKQLIDPKVVDLNDLIHSVKRMLVRLIGEDIELTTFAGEDLWAVKIDPGQFEQILVNLVVNARDAMPRGGRLVLRTDNAELDEARIRTHPHSMAGHFVVLSVTDTGVGISPEVREHLFEPFFTTKPKGRGTGLGLATIYGAVKQAGGFVEVESELGKGSTFRLYIPRVGEVAERIESEEPTPLVPGGNETILIVEDEPIVRDLAVRLLKRVGYRIIAASDGEEAIRMAEGTSSPIHLLLTDVVMPGLNGRQVAERIEKTHPETKKLYSSGYTENVIAHHGVIEGGLNFIGKPYTPYTLARKIREILDEP